MTHHPTKPFSMSLDGICHHKGINGYFRIMEETKNNVLRLLHKENLCTYFVLPLLGLNKASFSSEANFIDSYLSPDREFLLVKVLDTIFFEHRMHDHPNFIGVYKDDNGSNFVAYAIPARWGIDLFYFIQGKYSKMSTDAKEAIRTTSGLNYRVPPEIGANPVTDIRLLALDKSEAVREMWEDMFKVVMDDSQELLSVPSTNSFMTFQYLTRQK